MREALLLGLLSALDLWGPAPLGLLSPCLGSAMGGQLKPSLTGVSGSLLEGLMREGGALRLQDYCRPPLFAVFLPEFSLNSWMLVAQEELASQVTAHQP